MSQLMINSFVFAETFGLPAITLITGFLYGRRTACKGAVLRAYWVGDDDVYAAYTPAQALKQARADEGFAAYQLDDVKELPTHELCALIDGEMTLGHALAKMRRPGWIAGNWH
jgi:hypothetical protein